MHSEDCSGSLAGFEILLLSHDLLESENIILWISIQEELQYYTDRVYLY